MIRYSTHKATRVNVLHESDEDGEYIVVQLSSLYPHGIELCLDEKIWREIVGAGSELFGGDIRVKDRARVQAFGGTLQSYPDHQVGIDGRAIREARANEEDSFQSFAEWCKEQEQGFKPQAKSKKKDIFCPLMKKWVYKIDCAKIRCPYLYSPRTGGKRCGYRLRREAKSRVLDDGKGGKKNGNI